MQGNTDLATEVLSVSRKRNTQGRGLFLFFQKRDGAVKGSSYNAICSNMADLETVKLNEAGQTKKTNITVLLTCGV